MIKTYLVPITDELIKAMEKGEAPSFLHCATCLDGLTNGEIIQKMFPEAEVLHQYRLSYKDINIVTVIIGKQLFNFDLDWWNQKWGE